LFLFHTKTINANEIMRKLTSKTSELRMTKLLTTHKDVV